MSAHLPYGCHSSRLVVLSVFVLLLLLTLSESTPLPPPLGHPTSFEQLFSMDTNNATFTPLCDDELLRNVAQQVTQLRGSSVNVNLLLNRYDLRLEHIEDLLNERLPELQKPSSLIDVRIKGVGGSAAHSSSGAVNFPGVNTQTSASGGNLPASSSQSSAGGANLLPILAETSAAGGTNQLPPIGATTPPPSTSVPCLPALYNVPSPYTNPVLPTTCAEAVTRAGANAKSGIYQIYLSDSGLKPFYIYCQLDANGGPAWAVVQRRQDGSISFNRDWNEYQTGFGNLYGEFFIGLERLHGLTHARLNELWVQMEDFDNTSRYARYENFAIGDEHELYALNVLGKFEGNAGDSLRTSQGQKFSTKDADHDMWDRNCAAEYTGAWWYKACHDSNLNGQYLRGKYSKDKYGKGIDWTHWHGHEYSLKYVHMAIRPAQ